MMFGSMNAFGPEENFAFPPKPADPKAVWNIEWTAKARFRAFASFMTGMGNAGMRAGWVTAAPPLPLRRKSRARARWAFPFRGPSADIRTLPSR
jgi:hypothetical protein